MLTGLITCLSRTTIIRIPVLATFLGLSIHLMSQEPCLGEFHHDGSEAIYSGNAGESRYHVLLLLQDLTLADPNNPGGVSVEFSYRIDFRVDTLKNGRYGVWAHFGRFEVPPAQYRGFRLRQALLPQYAYLRLAAKNRFGLEAGILGIDSIPVSRENGSWLYREFDPGKEKGLCFSVRDVILALDESYYEQFRAELARVDRYHSALGLADSLQVMSDERLLGVDADIRDMIARWLEVRRILGSLRTDTLLKRLLGEYPDPEGLTGRLKELEHRFARQTFKTKALISHGGAWSVTGTAAASVGHYVKRLRGYREAGSKSYPFRQDLFTEISRPAYNQGELCQTREMMATALHHILPGGYETRLGKSLQGHILALAKDYRAKGEYQAAGEILQNAIGISRHWPGLDTGHLSLERTGLARETVSSYLNVCRQALQKENTELADHYFRKALESAKAFGSDPVIEALIGHEREELMAAFIRKADGYTMSGDYRRSLGILLFVSDYCYREQGLDCPDRLIPMIRNNHEKIYQGLIRESELRYYSGDLEKATGLMDEARLYREIHHDMLNQSIAEAQLEQWIRQRRYHDWIIRGEEALRFDDAELALYFFLRARDLEESLQVNPDTSLRSKISGTARPLIRQMLDDGMLKAWGLYLPEARKLLASGREMMKLYGLERDDALLLMAKELEESIHQKECRKKSDEYAVIFGSAMKEKQLGRFIAARDLVGKALELSRAHSDCGFNDMPAYAERIALEPLAEFENREKKVFLLLNSDYRAFIDRYQALSRDFQEKGLAGQGAKLQSLHEWALAKSTTGFLTFLVRHYLGLLQPEMALEVLNRIRELDPKAGNYTYLLGETGRQLALRDAGDPKKELAASYGAYKIQDKWFKGLWKKYRETWIDARGWKFSYLFLILK